MLTQLHQIMRYRDAIINIAVRDLKVRYSNSLLGIVWSFFNPLLMLLVLTLVFGVLLPSGIDKYPVFVLTGLLPWNFFSLSLLGSVTVVTANYHLVNRIFFPREILPISIIVSNTINFLIALILLFTFMWIFGVPVRATILWLPVVILTQILLSLGLSLVLSSTNVFFRDTQQIMEALMLAWFFLTPVLYSIERIPRADVRQLYLLVNPMASLIVNYRNLLYAGSGPDLGLLGIAAVEAILVALLGFAIFRYLSPSFAEEL